LATTHWVSPLPALSGHARREARCSRRLQVARGFLAGIVRKKLKLNLISERSDDVRVYRVSKDAAAAAKTEG
jgi:hypothetical protein